MTIFNAKSFTFLMPFNLDVLENDGYIGMILTFASGGELFEVFLILNLSIFLLQDS